MRKKGIKARNLQRCTHGPLLGYAWAVPAREIPDYIIKHLESHKLISIVLLLLNFDYGLRADLRLALYDEVRKIILLLVDGVCGLQFLCRDKPALRDLLRTLDPRIAAEGAQNEQAEVSELYIPLLGPQLHSLPTLRECQRQPSLATGQLLATILVCHLRALTLVKCILEPQNDADVHLAALHFLHMMSGSPAGAYAVSSGIFHLSAISSPALLNLLVFTPSSAGNFGEATSSTGISEEGPASLKAQPKTKSRKMVTVSAHAQFAVCLLQTVLESAFFPLTVPSLTPALLHAVNSLGELRISKQLKSQLTQIVNRLEPAIVAKSKGVLAYTEPPCKNRPNLCDDFLIQLI